MQEAYVARTKAQSRPDINVAYLYLVAGVGLLISVFLFLPRGHMG